MTDVTLESYAWSAGETLSRDTVFQCKEGLVLIQSIESGDAAPTGSQGILLNPGVGLQFSAGLVIYYRRANGDLNASRLARAPV